MRKKKPEASEEKTVYPAGTITIYGTGQPQYLKGIFQANLRGFGFVLREDEEDVFIPEENIKRCISGR